MRGSVLANDSMDQGRRRADESLKLSYVKLGKAICLNMLQRRNRQGEAGRVFERLKNSGAGELSEEITPGWTRAKEICGR